MFDFVIFILSILFILIGSAIGDSRRGYYESEIRENTLNRMLRERNERINALEVAKIFLKPYKKIFGDLCLSNKYCLVSISTAKRTIFCLNRIEDENGIQKCFVAKNFDLYGIDNYWNTLCISFKHSTSYQNVLDSCIQLAIVTPTTLQGSKSQLKEHLATRERKKLETLSQSQNIIDINNSSEVELTALPGISMIISKKIIKFRETVRPFKSVDDFFSEFKIKPHFQKQLRPILCANPINIKRCLRAKNERILDI